MLKFSRRHLGLCMIALTLGAAACSSSPERRESARSGQQSSGQLGEVESSEGSTDVSRTREVIRRETVRESEDIPTVSKRQVGADINRMDAKDFMAMGLNRDDAERVVQYREQFGRFRSVDSMKRVPGMDMAWLEKNREKLAASRASG